MVDDIQDSEESLVTLRVEANKLSHKLMLAQIVTTALSIAFVYIAFL